MVAGVERTGNFTAVCPGGTDTIDSVTRGIVGAGAVGDGAVGTGGVGVGGVGVGGARVGGVAVGKVGSRAGMIGNRLDGTDLADGTAVVLLSGFGSGTKGVAANDLPPEAATDGRGPGTIAGAPS